MSDEQLSHSMLKKLAQTPDYFAWYLWQYQQNENLSHSDVANFLHASSEQMEALSMCKVPDSQQPHFPKQLKAVADFAGVNHFPLAMLIRKVEAARALQRESTTTVTSIMAAREKDNSSQESSKKDECTDEQ